MADWVTISSLATAGGTLVLAAATFASVRSANRAARVAEQSLLAGIRPLLMPSHLSDPAEKIGFVDGKWVMSPGGGGVAEVDGTAVYLALSLRNVGTGIAVLHGWQFYPERRLETDRPPVDEFVRLTRDLYVPAGDTGFWQGAFRDPDTDEFRTAARAIADGEPVTVDVLYGDHEGGQRTITRFAIADWQGVQGERVQVLRHWSVDRDNPR
jgi:hypothetical protein